MLQHPRRSSTSSPLRTHTTFDYETHLLVKYYWQPAGTHPLENLGPGSDGERVQKLCNLWGELLTRDIWYTRVLPLPATSSSHNNNNNNSGKRIEKSNWRHAGSEPKGNLTLVSALLLVDLLLPTEGWITRCSKDATANSCPENNNNHVRTDSSVFAIAKIFFALFVDARSVVVVKPFRL